MSTLPLVPLIFRALRKRLLILGGFAALLLLLAGVARALSAGADHAELDRIFELGGATLGAAFIVLGWLLSRFPMLATLVLLAGVFSADHATGLTRLYAVRPVAPLRLYAMKFGVLCASAFILSAILLPLFDVLLLGQWNGPATLVLSAAYILAYAGLIALLSVFTRADSWVALLLGLFAMTWSGLRNMDMLGAIPAGGRHFVTLILPPHNSLLALENAFGQMLPIPWNAFIDVAIYGATLSVLAALALLRREV